MDNFTIGVIVVLYLLNGFAIWALTVQRTIKQSRRSISDLSDLDVYQLKKSMVLFSLFWPIMLLLAALEIAIQQLALRVYKQIYGKVTNG